MLALPLIAAAPPVPPDAGARGTRVAAAPPPNPVLLLRSLREGLTSVPKNSPTKLTTPHTASEIMDRRNQPRFSATDPSDNTYGMLSAKKSEKRRANAARPFANRRSYLLTCRHVVLVQLCTCKFGSGRGQKTRRFMRNLSHLLSTIHRSVASFTAKEWVAIQYSHLSLAIST